MKIDKNHYDELLGLDAHWTLCKVAFIKDELRVVNMDRFIVLINREKLDYTKWRKDLCEDMDISVLAEEAEKYSSSL